VIPSPRDQEFFTSSWGGSPYYLMAIHEQLPRIHKVELQQVGWTKATELAKVARRDGQRFDCATWLHKARELPMEWLPRTLRYPILNRS
jgi:hypothetical protein